MSGLWTANIGHSRRELAEAAYAQMLELPFYNTFFRTTHPPVVTLSRKLAELAPDNLNQVFYGSSGSEANDTAIRLIRHYWALKGEPKRRIIISRKSAYHGSTIAAGSMGGMSHVHAHSYPVYEGFRHIIDPYWYGESNDGESPEAFGIRAARALEDEILAIGPENVAAFAGEPVQGAGGVKIAPESYWPEVQRIVDRYGILFLADEVITGFGRLGTWFASQHYGMRPDFITFAKAVTSGYIPLSGVIVDDKIVDALMAHGDDFHHGYTFSGHPVACAVALKNIEIMEQERLVPRVTEFGGPALAKLLAKFKDHPLVGEVRSVGLLGAIELVADKRMRRRFADPCRVGLICRDHFFREGFIMRAVFDTMVTAPSLIWTQTQFDEAEVVIRRTLDLTLNDVAGELAA
jgi:putrescine---pyruvate transaminase